MIAAFSLPTHRRLANRLVPRSSAHRGLAVADFESLQGLTNFLKSIPLADMIGQIGEVSESFAFNASTDWLNAGVSGTAHVKVGASGATLTLAAAMQLAGFSLSGTLGLSSTGGIESGSISGSGSLDASTLCAGCPELSGTMTLDSATGLRLAASASVFGLSASGSATFSSDATLSSMSVSVSTAGLSTAVSSSPFYVENGWSLLHSAWIAPAAANTDATGQFITPASSAVTWQQAYLECERDELSVQRVLTFDSVETAAQITSTSRTETYYSLDTLSTRPSLIEHGFPEFSVLSELHSFGGSAGRFILRKNDIHCAGDHATLGVGTSRGSWGRVWVRNSDEVPTEAELPGRSWQTSAGGAIAAFRTGVIDAIAIAVEVITGTSASLVRARECAEIRPRSRDGLAEM